MSLFPLTAAVASGVTSRGAGPVPPRRDDNGALIFVDHLLEGGLDLLLLVGDDFVNRGPAGFFFRFSGFF